MWKQLQKCTGRDSVFSLALTAWLWTETRDVIHTATKQEFNSVKKYIEWLAKPRRVYGTLGTNVMIVVEAVVKSGKLKFFS